MIAPLQELEALIDRFVSRNDATAGQQLAGHVYQRLRHLARTTLQRETVPTTEENLFQLLQQDRPGNALEFFRFSARQLRDELLKLARTETGQQAADTTVKETTPEGDQVAQWSFHEKVGELVPEERTILDLCFYEGLTEEQAAQLLGENEEEVGRRWPRTLRKLPEVPLAEGANDDEIKARTVGDWKWVSKKLYSTELDQYTGQFVAVLDCQIVGTGPDRGELRRKVAKERAIAPQRLVIAYVGEEDLETE